MPRLAKAIFHRQVLFITTSVEEGLPLPPNALINAILRSCLARAQYHHPVRVCHYLFESNHLHMIAIVDNPMDIKGFMERFKTESAHAVNHLLGRKKKTIWCEGYDCPMLGTVEDVIEKTVYLYTNPAKDNLEQSISRYPGLSSWRAYRKGETKVSCPWITRRAVQPLHKTEMAHMEFVKLASKYRREAKVQHVFEVFPNIWMECFGIRDHGEQEKINRKIIHGIREREQEFKELREKNRKGVIGARNLMLKPMDTPHVPNRTGKKMWCISWDVEFRKAYISFVQELVAQAREVYQRWKEGDSSAQYPVGLFPPPMPKVAELMPQVWMH